MIISEQIIIDWLLEQAMELDRCYALQRMSAWVREASP